MALVYRPGLKLYLLLKVMEITYTHTIMVESFLQPLYTTRRR